MLEGLGIHPLATPKAKRLPPLAFDEYAAASADLLGLAPYADLIEASNAFDKARRALVLQANALIERGTEADIYLKESVDSYSKDYRDDAILPYAQLLANDVLAAIGVAVLEEESYAVIRTRR